jgi:hypothetical protein
MAYSYNNNLSPTGPDDAIFQLKAVLKTALWTVPASSDGTTYNAAGDQITTAASGAGGMANTSAWFRIRSPAGAGGKEFTFQRGTTNNSWRVKYSVTSGFTGGTPGITQTASATDEAIVMGGGTDASPTYNTNLFGITSGFRWHCAADGASPYPFFACGYANGGGAPGATNMPALIVHDPMTSGTAEANDADPTVLIFSGMLVAPGSGVGMATGTCLIGGNGSPTNIATWHRKGLAGFSGDNTFNRAGDYYMAPWSSSTITVNGGTYQSVVGSASSATAPVLLGTSLYSLKDNLLPIMYVHGNSSYIDAVKGVSSIMRWVGAPSRNNGDTYTVSTSKDRIIIGILTFPWDGSSPVV